MQPISLLVSTALTTALVAQESELNWKWLAEVRIGDKQDAVVAKLIDSYESFRKAALADGASPNETCRAFLTRESLAALPMRFRVFHGKTDKGVDARGMHWDYQKAIDYSEMFAPMLPDPVGDDAFSMGGMVIKQVPNPAGGYRANFFNQDLLSDNPSKNPLLSEFRDFDVKPKHARRLRRIQQAPISISIDLHPMLDREDAKFFTGFVGTRARLLSAIVTRLGRRPMVEAYSEMRPGEGLIGQYLSPKTKEAEVLGTLPFAPGLLVAANLGALVPRSLRTLVNGLAPNMGPWAKPTKLFLDSWNGTLTLVGDVTPMPSPLPKVVDPLEIEKRFATTTRGTLLLGIEDGDGKELVAAFESCFREIAKAARSGIRAVESNGRQAFLVNQSHHVCFGTSGELFAISAAPTLQACLAQCDASLAPESRTESTTKVPVKFRLTQGPVKLWASQGTVRYIAAAYRGLLRPPESSSIAQRSEWALDTLEKDLLAEDFAATLNWSRRRGVVLRMLF